MEFFLFFSKFFLQKFYELQIWQWFYILEQLFFLFLIIFDLI